VFDDGLAVVQARSDEERLIGGGVASSECALERDGAIERALR
jgi:hypothetical protein